MLKLQTVVSASTIALRDIEVEQAEAQEAAINSITILSGCNRTVDMQYAFVVSILLPCHGCLLQIMSTTVSSGICVCISCVTFVLHIKCFSSVQVASLPSVCLLHLTLHSCSTGLYHVACIDASVHAS